MVFKFVVFFAALAYASAGFIGAPAAVAYSAAPVVSQSYINQGVAPVAYAAPVAHAAYAAPIAHAAYAAPVAHAAYAAPIAHAAYAGPVAHAAYAAPIAHAAYAAPAYGAPVVARTAAVAYSPASVVSHSTFSGYGVNYGW